ncbi:hypothetical protein DM01DRAFT_1134615 [Hesseltinella vesiculosa]|uniref:SWIM-type domain-containing protein n=1 Tax=Hesseltinella vesiculosa TaxID=101127 RepID=A0A1X2G8Y7_9FUNG|nr:hypothetical protein DM01DRAFT_1134615 [Hesseltinella vesiculosa]
MESCTCPDHENRGALCKHMFAVNQLLGVPLPPFTPSYPSTTAADHPATSHPSIIAENNAQTEVGSSALQPVFEK